MAEEREFYVGIKMKEEYHGVARVKAKSGPEAKRKAREMSYRELLLEMMNHSRSHKKLERQRAVEVGDSADEVRARMYHWSGKKKPREGPSVVEIPGE